MNDIKKLPKWAQEHITTLERERDIAIRALNDYCDSQTPSVIYVDEYKSTGEERGPSSKRRYFNGQRVTVEFADIKLDIYAGSYGNFISLQWQTSNRSNDDVALIPESFCRARLVSKNNMRG